MYSRVRTTNLLRTCAELGLKRVKQQEYPIFCFTIYDERLLEVFAEKGMRRKLLCACKAGINNALALVPGGGVEASRAEARRILREEIQPTREYHQRLLSASDAVPQNYHLRLSSSEVA